MASKKSQEKLFYKIGEVCERTDTQPYVLRFWESEFPQLAPQKNRSGQRIYRTRDIEIVEEIKRLLYDEGYTIAGARKRLDNEGEADNGKMPLLEHAEALTGEEPPTAAAMDSDLRKRALDELREILRIMQEFDRRIAALEKDAESDP